MNKLLIRFTALSILTLSFSTTSMASWNKDELKHSLKEALMEANYDYNQHKKKVLDSENTHIDSLNRRQNEAIDLNGQDLASTFSTDDFKTNTEVDSLEQELSLVDEE